MPSTDGLIAEIEPVQEGFVAGTLVYLETMGTKRECHREVIQLDLPIVRFACREECSSAPSVVAEEVVDRCLGCRVRPSYIVVLQRWLPILGCQRPTKIVRLELMVVVEV